MRTHHLFIRFIFAASALFAFCTSNAQVTSLWGFSQSNQSENLEAAESTSSPRITHLTRSTPEAEGISSKDVLEFLDKVMGQKDTDIHGIMVLRNGKVIAEKGYEPWNTSYGHTLYSCSKSFTAVAVGIAIDEGKLHLNDRLVDILPAEMLPTSIPTQMRSITVRNLLTMQSGLKVDVTMRTKCDNWVRTYLSNNMACAPGTNYAYDSIDSYLLCAIVQRVMEKSVFELLRERVFQPMGITEAAWEESPEGITCGGWGLYLNVESMAKFGQLILQKGKWENRQLVSPEWINQMISHQSATAAGTKYGYHIWLMNKYPGVTRCDGLFGQYIYIIPDKQMVIAMTQCMRGNGNLEHNAMWQLTRKAGNTPLMPGKEYNQLVAKHYVMPYAEGKEESRTITGPLTIQLGSNMLGWKQLRITPTTMAQDTYSSNKKEKSAYSLSITVTTESKKTFTLECGHRIWTLSAVSGLPLNLRAFRNNFSNIPTPFLASSSYGWSTDNDLNIRMHFVNWLSSCTLHLHFSGNTVKADITPSNTTKSTPIIASMH